MKSRKGNDPPATKTRRNLSDRWSRLRIHGVSRNREGGKRELGVVYFSSFYVYTRAPQGEIVRRREGGMTSEWQDNEPGLMHAIALWRFNMSSGWSGPRGCTLNASEFSNFSSVLLLRLRFLPRSSPMKDRLIYIRKWSFMISDRESADWDRLLRKLDRR